MNIKQAIQEDLQSAIGKDDAAELSFHWNDDEKTWCFSGTTIGGLVFETDDCEAETREEAEADAVEFLRWHTTE